MMVQRWPNTLFGLVLACQPGATDHVHDDQGNHVAADDGHGHGHGHGHSHGGGIAVTHFTDVTELFVEFDPLVVGHKSAFAAHLTRLSDYRAVDAGRLTVVLSGGGAADERFEAPVSDTPGIFRPVAIPAHAGARTVRLELKGPDLTATHELGTQMVYAGPEQVPHEQEEEEDSSISFLKEQQWKMPFMVEAAELRTLNQGLRVFGRVRARPDGEAIVTSPGHGRLLAHTSLPSVGMTVDREDRLAVLAPALETGGDLASLELAVERARVAMNHQEQELARVTALRDRGAVSDRRVAEVKLARDQAAAERQAGKRRVAQFRRLQRPGARRSQDTVDVRAPIAGSVVDVRATPGAYVEDGQLLFRIVDPAALRVHAFVPEADLPRLETVRGAWIWLEHGEDSATPLRLGSDAVVTTGGPVDPSRHAVEVLLALPAESRARVGQSVDVQLIHGDPIESITVPLRAIVWEGGVANVFVMVGGESFERRQIQLGIRDGPSVAVQGGGLAEGERIVTVGADLVALTEAAPAQAGHGHPH